MKGQISISVKDRNYPIACDAGQEERIKTLGAYVDEKARDLTQTMGGRVNDLHLMVLVAIVLADELAEALDVNEKMAAKQVSVPPQDPRLSDPKFLKTLDMLASRMENIAGTLEGR